YRQLTLAWAAISAGRLSEAQSAARKAVDLASYFGPMARPLAARAALWDGDTDRVREFLGELSRVSARGSALSADILTVRAGMAALEGRAADAMASYREALRAWQILGLAWDEALCAIDMATVLDPADPEVRSAAEAAQST